VAGGGVERKEASRRFSVTKRGGPGDEGRDHSRRVREISIRGRGGVEECEGEEDGSSEREEERAHRRWRKDELTRAPFLRAR